MASLWSAVRVARMLIDARGAVAEDGNRILALERSLKRTQVVTGRSRVAVLVWEDLTAALALDVRRGREAYAVSDRVDGREVGVVMADLGRAAPDDLSISVRLRNGPIDRAVPFSIVTLAWNGDKLDLTEQRGRIEPREIEAMLGE